MSQIAALTDARILCDNWAALSAGRKFVVKNEDRYFLADSSDLRTYHRRDIASKRASVVHIGKGK